MSAFLKHARRSRAAWLVVAVGAGIAAGPFTAYAAPAAEAVQIGTFKRPVHVTVAPGYGRLLFVVEQQGRIMVLRDENTLPKPFLNLRGIVQGPPDSGAGNEEGLLSVAFPPDYEETGLFYVYFTNNKGNNEVDEFKRSEETAVRADRESRRIVLVIPHSTAANHNGGQLQFGPDGHLYVSTGDGGRNTPAGEPARDLGSLLGKILRIDPRKSGPEPYTIPAGNPFVGKHGRDEIFAYGFRNPWRFAFDGRRLMIGDVGQSRREEINILPKADARGANFGWPQYEGELVFDDDRPGERPPTFPIHTYGHGGGRCAVIGGYVVRDRDVSALAGRYIYGDACTGKVRSFKAEIAAQEAADDKPTGIVLPGLSAFGEGFGGQIYMTQTGGGVWRLEQAIP